MAREVTRNVVPAPDPGPEMPETELRLPPPGYVPVHAPSYIHATSPEGEEVTYLPNERLPQWLRDELAAGAVLEPEAKNVARLVPRGGRKR